MVLERFESTVRLSGVGMATSEQSAAALISSQIERLCGAMPPAPLRPTTLDIDDLVEAVHDGDSLRRFLTHRRLDPDQIATLVLAADTTKSAQACIVATQSGRTNPAARACVEPGAVAILDTPSGRLVSERVIRAGRPWMIVSPGSGVNIASAVGAMMRRLPERPVR